MWIKQSCVALTVTFGRGTDRPNSIAPNTKQRIILASRGSGTAGTHTNATRRLWFTRGWENAYPLRLMRLQDPLLQLHLVRLHGLECIGAHPDLGTVY